MRALWTLLAGLVIGGLLAPWYHSQSEAMEPAPIVSASAQVVPPAPASLPPLPPEPGPRLPEAPETPIDAERSLGGPHTQAPSALLIPVSGIEAAQLDDSFADGRGGTRVHEAIDIMAPAGTPVLAAADGRVAKLFSSKPGGLTVYQFDPGETVAYYYAHLDRYAENLAEGQQLKRGDLIGYVGSSGNADPAAPHLHFAVFMLGPEKQWWKGTAINPYPLLVSRGLQP